MQYISHMVAERGHALERSAEKAVGSRQPAWRPTTSVEKKEKSKSNEQQAANAKEYAVNLEVKLQMVCNGILALMDEIIKRVEKILQVMVQGIVVLVTQPYSEYLDVPYTKPYYVQMKKKTLEVPQVQYTGETIDVSVVT